MVKKGVYIYYNKRGILSRTKPKGCGTPSKGTKIKFKGPDVRIRNCHPIKKKTKRKSSKKKGRRKSRKK